MFIAIQKSSSFIFENRGNCKIVKCVPVYNIYVDMNLDILMDTVNI